MKKNNVYNKFLFFPKDFSYCFIPNFAAILINHESFFQEKKSSQLYHSQFLEINSLMTEIIKNQFPKTKFW